MELSYVVKDAKKWEVDPEKTASELDAGSRTTGEGLGGGIICVFMDKAMN